jgi:hypothetical protein
MIKKYGEIDGTERYDNWRHSHRCIIKKSISKISQKLFFDILKNIEDKENVKFGDYNKEFFCI